MIFIYTRMMKSINYQCILASLTWLFLFSSFSSVTIHPSYSQDPAQDSGMDPKSRLIRDVKQWVASEERVDSSNIDVQASDRRFVVPDCSDTYGVRFAFGSKGNVEVSCDSQSWKAVLRININKIDEVLAYTRSITQGEIITSQDIEIIELDTSLSGSRYIGNQITRSEAEGRMLKIDVKSQDPVNPNQFDASVVIYTTNLALKKGQKIELSMVEAITKPVSETQFSQRMDSNLILNSVLTRDVSVGSVLSTSDLALSAQAIVITSLIERGSMIDPSNVRVASVTERMPGDAITSISQLNRAITKRRLTPGSILRFSDISIQPHVVAGQSTTLRLTKPQFTLTLEMLALEDGYIGDRIRVRNIESQEIVFATVIDVGLVEIQQ